MRGFYQTPWGPSPPALSPKEREQKLVAYLDAQGVVTEPTHLGDEVVGGCVPRGSVGQF